MNNSALVKLGSSITPMALKLRIPLVKTMVKGTIFKQFVGGESLAESQKTIQQLHKFKTFTILDYGAESKTSEEELDAVLAENIRAIEMAQHNSAVPIVVSKITSFFCTSR